MISKPPTVERPRPLTFHDLRVANTARLIHFKNNKGELAHDDPHGRDWSINDWFTAFTGEVGEFGNVAKKFRRGDLTQYEFDEMASRELADCQIYLDLLAKRCGFNLAAITMRKFNETSIKVGSPIRLTVDGMVEDVEAVKHEVLPSLMPIKADALTSIETAYVQETINTLEGESVIATMQRSREELEAQSEAEQRVWYGYADPWNILYMPAENFERAGGLTQKWGIAWKRIVAGDESTVMTILDSMRPPMDGEKPIRKAFEDLPPFDSRAMGIDKPFPNPDVACDDLDLLSIPAMLYKITQGQLPEPAPYYGTWNSDGAVKICTEEEFKRLEAPQGFLPVWAPNIVEAMEIVRKWSLMAYDVNYGPIEGLAEYYQVGSVPTGKGARAPGKPRQSKP